MIGREVSVLFEKDGRIKGQMIGKSQYLHAVFADAPNVTRGDIRRVKIVESEKNSLKGVLLG
jgi:tRNA-2-methylthio-N6-dimethylallyladenosine synthase